MNGEKKNEKGRGKNGTDEGNWQIAKMCIRNRLFHAIPYQY